MRRLPVLSIIAAGAIAGPLVLMRLSVSNFDI
jgi:hypothetical protein